MRITEDGKLTALRDIMNRKQFLGRGHRGLAAPKFSLSRCDSSVARCTNGLCVADNPPNDKLEVTLSVFAALEVFVPLFANNDHVMISTREHLDGRVAVSGQSKS